MTKTKKKTKGGVPKDVSQKRAFGSILIQRFANKKVPATLAAALKAFTTAHNDLKNATTAVAKAHGVLTNADEQLVAADKQLSNAIQTLANAAVGAGVGTRQKPFASFTKKTPSMLVKLGYSNKVTEARALVNKLQAKKLPAAVVAAVKNLDARADAVATSLGGITDPDAALSDAHEDLAPIMTAWSSSYSRLKTLAAAAWIDSPKTFNTVFKKPAPVQAPKPKKTKGKAAKKAAQTAQQKAASAAKKAAAAAKRAAAKAAKVATATPAAAGPATTAVPANGVSGPAKPAPAETSA